MGCALYGDEETGRFGCSPRWVDGSSIAGGAVLIQVVSLRFGARCDWNPGGGLLSSASSARASKVSVRAISERANRQEQIR